MAHRRRIISRRTIRGHIFALKSEIKEFLRRAPQSEIGTELRILRNLERTILAELKEEESNGRN